MAEKAPRTVVETAYYEGTKDVQAILYSDGTILINGIRFSYPHFGKAFEAKSDDGKVTDKWSMKGMMPKKTHKPAMRLMKKHMEDMMKANNTSDLASDRKYLRNGDDLGKTEMKDHFVFSASETSPPKVRDRNAQKIDLTDKEKEALRKDPTAIKQAIEKKIDAMFYGGAWGNALIRPWWQNHQKHGKRVNSGLSAVQFAKDDEPFGEGRIDDEAVDDTFAPVAGGDNGFDDTDLDDL